MFRFENTIAFNWLWVLPILLGMTIVMGFLTKRQLEKAIGNRLYPFLTSSFSPRKRKMKWIFQAVTFCLMVLALARPQLGESMQEVKSEGVEMMLLVDVSESMMAEDIRPSRLEQAKAELSRLIEMMPGNKVGVVAFAGSATLLSPLTNDPGALKMYIDSLSPLSVSSQGTNFQKALEEAEAAFQRGGVTVDETVRVTRVILMASDGEDHEQGALDAAKKLTDKGMRLFTIAYGTERGGAIPERDQVGFLKGNKKDRKGNVILTTVKGDALRSLAEAGKGTFSYSVFGGNHLENIVDDINKLEKKQFDTQIATQYEERFQIFLGLALLFGLFELWLGERKSSFKLWKGRFEVPPA